MHASRRPQTAARQRQKQAGDPAEASLTPLPRNHVLEELTRLTETTGFWDNNDKANVVLKEKAAIERSLRDWNTLSTRLNDLEAMAELASEEGGESMRAELEQEIAVIQKDIASAEVAAMLSGEQDATNAIVSIHPGAGGTEAQDWAEMLMRMYLRWAEKRGYKTEILDYQNGEEAGVKSVTFTDFRRLCLRQDESRGRRASSCPHLALSMRTSAGTPPLHRSMCILKSRMTSTYRSMKRICASTPTAHRAPAAST